MGKTRIVVSPEMLAYIGAGSIARDGWPERSVGLSFRLAEGLVATHPDPGSAALADADLVFIVTSEACRRLFGTTLREPARWHLPSELRAIALAVRDCDEPATVRETLQLAKSIELLCAVMGRLVAGALIPVADGGELNARDATRVVAARRLVDERWAEKLTLELIARACGLNRAKLTRGFRLMFHCSVADAIAENRLSGARRLLLASDLPVSSVGYRCGYLNNASFTRAFSRRFGVAPTQLRRLECAA